MTARTKPLHQNVVVVNAGSPALFQTDNGNLVVFPTIDDQGRIALRYEYHSRIPELKQTQRN